MLTDHRRPVLASRASWRREKAPKTVAAFERLLPFHSKIIHVRWSGESAWIPLGDLDIGLDGKPENATSHPAPGQVLWYPGGLSETEILFPYGGTMFASIVGQLAGNHFLTIVEGVDQLRPLGEHVLWKGALDIVFDRDPHSGNACSNLREMPQPRVQSLDRALDLLEALAGADELGVSEIAAQTGLVPSTAHRLLGTLVARGYAAQNPTTGRYLLGYKLLELTSGVQDRLGAAAHGGAPAPRGDPERDRRDDEPGRARGPRRRLRRQRLRHAQRAPVHRGRPRDPRAHVRRRQGAAGVARPRGRRGAARRRAAGALHAAHADDAGRAQEDLARIRRRGYSDRQRGARTRRGCVATPVLDHAGRPLAAISVSGPTSRILHADTADLARAAARARRSGGASLG